MRAPPLVALAAALVLGPGGIAACAQLGTVEVKISGGAKTVRVPERVAGLVRDASALAEAGTASARRDAGARFVAAARESGGAPSVLLAAAASLHPEGGTCKAMLDVSPDPLDTAVQALLAARKPSWKGDGWVPCLVAVLLAHVPSAGRLPILEHHDPAGLVVALEHVERMRQTRASPDALYEATRELLDALLDHGDELLAARVWSASGEELRERLLADPPEPLRLTLTLLAFGARADAERVLARGVDSGDGPERAVIDLTLRGGAVDPFELARRDSVPEGDAFRILAARALRERAPSLAWSHLDTRGVRPPASPISACHYLPAACRLMSEALSEQDAAVAAELARTPGRVEDPRERKVTATIARLLARPAPMPLRVTPRPDARPESFGWLPGQDNFVRPSEGQLRSERSGDGEFVIEASFEADPGAGGYWLVERSAGRETRTYLGLRANAPYVVLPSSQHPLVNEGVLRLEAKIAERGRLDRIVRWGGPVLLEAPLEELRRDRDHDGLTDLLEERLLTDPDDPDTDGDGLPDGSDVLPSVPEGPPSVEAAALSAFLSKGSLAPLARFTVGHRGHWRGVRPEQRTVVLTRAEQRVAEERFGWFEPLSTVFFWADAYRGCYLWRSPRGGACVELLREGGVWRSRTFCFIR